MDEGYLFDIANNYAIRHHNPDQKTDYQAGVWLDWMFYAFLNAIDVATKLVSSIAESNGSANPDAAP